MSTLGSYELVRELGRGGMGVVYEARHPRIPRPLAIKLIHTKIANRQTLERFRREAHALAKVRHPNVVAVHDLGEDPQGLYLVTDLVPGQNLQDLSERGGPFDPRRAAAVARDLAGALEAIHGAGILHRDLKPDNVILKPDDVPVLLDFGVARDADSERLTQTGAVIGTPAFMSPEQADGSSPSTLDARSDVYGLGAILFTILAGRVPFLGGSPVNVLRKVIMQDPDWPDIPVELLAILRKTMAKEREDRYASAAALGEDLRRFLAGEQVQAPAARSGRRALWVWAAVVLVGFGVWAFLPPGSQPEESKPVEEATTPEAEPEPRDWVPDGLKSDRPLLRARAYREARGRAGLRDRLEELRARPLLELKVGEPGTLAHGVFCGDGVLVTDEKQAIEHYDLTGDVPRVLGRWEIVGIPTLNVRAFATQRDGRTAFAACNEYVFRLTLGSAGGPLRAKDAFWKVPDTAVRVNPDKGIDFDAWDIYALALREETLTVGGEWLDVFVIDLATRATRTLGPHRLGDKAVGKIRHLVFTQQGRRLLTNANSKHGHLVSEYQVRDARRIRTLPHSVSPVSAVALSPDGATLVLGRNDGSITFHDARTQAEQRRLRGKDIKDLLGLPVAHPHIQVVALVFSEDGRRLYSLGHKKNGTTADLRVWEGSRQLEAVSLPYPAETLSLSPDGGWLLVGTEAGKLLIWGAPP